ncbi:SAF domain-containing protein [Streptomyces sp. NPDC050738]|uniref:SAF domain-containing protein n=1 Tax=Streptomyces sp. NPDC050738 TaxID=3154744 RepID=UPI0034241098
MVLVALPAAGFAWITAYAGDRTPVLMVARDVPAGRVLGVGDLRVVQVAADRGVVPAGRQAQVLGKRATGPLVAGSLLAPGEFGTQKEYPPKGFSVLSFAVEAGSAPPRLEPGERIAVLEGAEHGSAAGGGQAADEKSAPVVVGTVAGVKEPVATGGPRVLTMLAETSTVRRATQMQQPRVVVLPSEGREAP